MRYSKWKFVAVGLAMLAAAAAAAAMKPSRKLSDVNKIQLERMVPSTFGEWTVDPTIVPVAPSTDVQANLNRIYDQILSRTYVNPRNERMMLTIAYGGTQNDSLKAHRQEVCYSAQGFRISGLLHSTLQVGASTIPVTRMFAEHGSRAEPVTYWFTMGDKVVLGRFERLMVQLKYGLTGEIPDGMLVRVSNLSAEPERAYGAQVEFVRALVASMKKEDAAHLLGGLGG